MGQCLLACFLGICFDLCWVGNICGGGKSLVFRLLPQPWLAPPGQFSSFPVYTLGAGRDILWCGTCIWPVQIRCPSRALSWLLVNPLAVRAWKTEKSLMSRVSTTEERPKHVGVLSTLFSYRIQNTALATRKKVYSIPAEKRTPVWCQSVSQLSDMPYPCFHKLSGKVLAFLSTALVAYCVCFLGPLGDFHSV